MPNRRRVALVGWVAVVAVALGVLWTCKPQPTIEPQATRGPRGIFPPESVLAVSLARIKQYADSLRFDRELGADSEMVDFERGQIGTGILAVIEPESTSHLLRAPALMEGRIIARIRTATEVRSRGFGPWWTWWWVDRGGPNGGWRSIFISEVEKSVTDRKPWPKPLLVNDRYRRRYQQALARWKVVSEYTSSGDPFMIAAWGTCNVCCKQ